jgi:hypothetical protein
VSSGAHRDHQKIVPQRHKQERRVEHAQREKAEAAKMGEEDVEVMDEKFQSV